APTPALGTAVRATASGSAAAERRSGPAPYTPDGGSPADALTQAPAPEPAPAAGSAPLSAAELEELLLSVVAQLTGYPTEMLHMDMELEADLGVDSIKRVEILSAVRRRVGDLATEDVGRLGKLRTLREIVQALTEAAGAVPSGSPAPKIPTAPDIPTTPDIPTRSGRQEATALTRLVPRTVEAPASGLMTAGLLDGPVVVTGEGPDGAGITGLVAHKLAAHGIDATALAEVPQDARAVVHLGGLTASGASDEAREVHRSVFRAARAVAARAAGQGGLFVTVQDTG
ncbi:phosphopantetheine-binding protein, partial [Streptomyces halstedii]